MANTVDRYLPFPLQSNSDGVVLELLRQRYAYLKAMGADDARAFRESQKEVAELRTEVHVLALVEGQARTNHLLDQIALALRVGGKR